MPPQREYNSNVAKLIGDEAHARLPPRRQAVHDTDDFFLVLEGIPNLPTPSFKRPGRFEYKLSGNFCQLKGVQKALEPWLLAKHATFTQGEIDNNMHLRLLADALVLSGEHPWCQPDTRANSPEVPRGGEGQA